MGRMRHPQTPNRSINQVVLPVLVASMFGCWEFGECVVDDCPDGLSDSTTEDDA
jgi:hypothetical protein